MPAELQVTDSGASGLHVRLLGPDAAEPCSAELRRLFAGRSLSRQRRERLLSSPRVVAVLGDRVIGLAAFERSDEEVRVYELAVAGDLAFSAFDIARQLLDALELSCMAANCRRLVLLPAAVVATGPLERLGYRLAGGCSGGWVEKVFH
ncbi:MAG: hypothetical protein KJ061_02285 [Vicinamibacteraceae bacterium]|nr:hypothetical protein [Vicinamibacteraceae bacterium]